ncbi:MAG: putative toxin-antitoxin system toxin component, PIN family [Spirochaetaceae bacterium]|nr:putative toxin-antitoxin system toxin component, PIN family [Spirochaetaceae bacterium]
MRVVLDTGILIAALITRNTPPDQLYQLWRKRRFTLITSELQLDEFRRVTRYRKLRRYLKPHEVGTLVRGVRARASIVSDLPDIDLVDDPGDNLVLATALAGDADYLVTGDRRHLLHLKKVRQTRILTARELACRLD